MLTQDKLWLDKDEIQVGFKTLIASLHPNRWGNFITNNKLPLSIGRRMLIEFHADIEQRLLGKYFYRHRERRILSFCFPEHIDDNLHYHAPMYVPPEFLVKFDLYAPSVWKKICPSGNALFCPLRKSDDVFGTARYSVKDTWCIKNYESFIVPMEFWNPKTRSTCGAPSMEHNRGR